jgi:hypothetical protein
MDEWTFFCKMWRFNFTVEHYHFLIFSLSRKGLLHTISLILKVVTFRAHRLEIMGGQWEHTFPIWTTKDFLMFQRTSHLWCILLRKSSLRELWSASSSDGELGLSKLSLEKPRSLSLMMAHLAKSTINGPFPSVKGLQGCVRIIVRSQGEWPNW